MSADGTTGTPQGDASNHLTDHAQRATPPADASRQHSDAHARQPDAPTRQDHADVMLARPPGHAQETAARPASSDYSGQAGQERPERLPASGPGGGRNAGHKAEGLTRQEHADVMLASPPGHAQETAALGTPAGHDSRKAGQAQPEHASAPGAEAGGHAGHRAEARTRQDHADAMLASPPGHVQEAAAHGIQAGHDSRRAEQAPGAVNAAGETIGTGASSASVRDSQNDRSANAAAAGTELDAPGGQRGLDGGQEAAGGLPESDDHGTAREAVASRQATDSQEAAGPGNAAELAKESAPADRREPALEADETEALRRKIAELEAESAAKDATIAGQHDAIDAKDAALAEKDAVIASQWRTISELDYRIDDLTAGKADLAAEKADLAADEASPGTRNELRDVTTVDRADQSLVPDEPGTSGEEQAGEEGIDGRTAVLGTQEEKQPAPEQKRLRPPSNEAAGFFLTGVAGLGIAVASVTHQLSGDGAVVAGAVAACIASGVPWVNKIWKRDTNGNRSEDRGTNPNDARPRDPA